MITNLYAKAYTEVLEIISHFSEEEYSKIPKDKIEFYKKNMDKNHKFAINPEIELSKQNISKEANAILITLFRDYFATERQKEILEHLLKQNREKIEQKKRELYNPDSIFKDSKKEIIEKDNTSEETQLMEYKESFFSKFKKFIFKLLHIEI